MQSDASLDCLGSTLTAPLSKEVVHVDYKLVLVFGETGPMGTRTVWIDIKLDETDYEKRH